MKVLSTPILVVLLALFVVAACTEKPSYPATDAAISDASSDAADISTDDTGDVSSDTEPDTQADTGPCQGACSGQAPHCEPAIGECVACLDDDDCTDGLCADDNTCVECLETDDCSEGVCDPANNTCVACLADDDCTDGVCAGDNTCVECLINDECTDPTASACNTATNTCEACADSAACSHLDDTTVCDTSGENGVCVECTVDDESPCEGTSCDPATNMCTGNLIGQTQTCMPCKADSECVADHRCIAMNFKGNSLADGYCLKTVGSGCTRPFGAVIISRESLSGALTADYCGIAESLTSCVAITDFGEDCTGSGDSACGLQGQDDGRCETLGAFEYRCTYSCTRDDSCSTGDSCGGSPVGTDYCGG